ncbi:MAG: PIN domain-containing protein, partial [Candidatus Omnitrophota bacterium]
MLSLNILRGCFILICTATGYSFGGQDPYFLTVVGFAVSVSMVVFETLARKISLKGLSSTVFGVILGLILAKIFSDALKLFSIPDNITYTVRTFVTLIFVYLGLTLGLKGRSEFNLVIPYVKFKKQEIREEEVVVDTSCIIDGRIVDIVKTGFLEARFIVPRFVLNELHALADSTDHMKRQKGKRGIEILHSLKKEPNIEVKISDEEISVVKSVDEKIVKLAQDMGAAILTTDYNLNRI